jgi:hypothetical protein
VHWRQVPHVAHNCPRGHHHIQVLHHRVLATVPEGVTKLWIVLQTTNNLTLVERFTTEQSHYLNSYWVNHSAYFEASLFELHDGGVVNASSLGENQNRWVVRVANVFL